MADQSKAYTYKNRGEKPDVCEHGILRTSCQQCPQKEDLAKAKALQIAKAQKFILRNFVVENMDAFCSWDLYVDPKTGKNVDGGAIFRVLLAMCKHSYADGQKVWPGDKKLAKLTGLTRSYIQIVKRTMHELGLMAYHGPSKFHTGLFSIRLEQLEKFVKLARIRIEAPPDPDWLEGFVPDVKGDNLEELQIAQAEDQEVADDEEEIPEEAMTA